MHFPLCVDVKVWATKGDQGAKNSMFTEGLPHMLTKWLTVWKDPPRIAEIGHTTAKPVSSRTVSKCTGTLSLSSFSLSLLRRYAGYQFWHNSSLTVRLFFFPRIRWFLYQCQSDPLRTPVCLWSCSRSTSAFGKNPLLSRRTWKACCPLQRCTALVVCSSLKEPMFMFRIMAQQEYVWCPYSPMKVNHEEVWLDGSKCWRTGLWFASRLLPTLINIYLQQSKVWNPKKSFCYLNLPKA